MATTYQGTCFCGTVRVEVEDAPMFQGYCHCTDCRTWAAAPLSAYALWAEGKARVVDGAEELTRFSKSGKADRLSCRRCGGNVMTELPGAGLVDVYPAILAGFPFEPAAHVFYGERMIDFPDPLPKFRDLPQEAGGSGETIQD